MLGALIGIPLGLFASFLINLSVLPATPTLWSILVAFGAAFMVGVLAGVFPARQATKVEITEALRAEF
jgi:putative ABC transport system permease protein